MSRCQRAPVTVSGPREAGSVSRTAPVTKRRSGSSVRTSMVTSPRTPWGRPMRPTTTVSEVGGGVVLRCSASVGVDDVDPQAAAADPGHDLAQRLGGAPAAADDLAEVVGVHPHLEGLPATAVQQVDGDVLGVVDDALDQVLERFFEHVLLGGRLGRRAGLGGGRLGRSLGSGVGLPRRGLLLRGGGAGGGLLATDRADSRLVQGLLVRLRRGDLHRRRGRLALELLPVAGDPEDGGDGLGRLRADTQPVLGTLAVDLDEGGILLRVVLADRFDRAAVTLGAGVGDDDAVVRGAHLAHAHELDLGGHGGWCTPRTLRSVARRSDAWGYAGAEPGTRPATVRGPPTAVFDRP